MYYTNVLLTLNLTKIYWNIFEQKFSSDDWSKGSIRLQYMPLCGCHFHPNRLRVILIDMDFEKLYETLVNTEVVIVAVIEHVVEVERTIRTLK